MASLIWLGHNYPQQDPVKMYRGQTAFNLEENICGRPLASGSAAFAIIAKGNVLEGVEAKT